MTEATPPDTKACPTPEEAARQALERARKKREDAFTKEFGELCERHRASLHVVEVRVNGQTASVELRPVLRD